MSVDLLLAKIKGKCPAEIEQGRQGEGCHLQKGLLSRYVAPDAVEASLVAEDKADSAPAQVGKLAGQNSQSHDTSVILEAAAGMSHRSTIVEQDQSLNSAREESGQCKRHHGVSQSAEGPALEDQPVSLQDRSAGGVCTVIAASRMPHRGTQAGVCEAEPHASSSMPPHQEMTGFSGIPLVTASGKPIRQASKNLSRAANLFADLFEEQETAGEPARLGVVQPQLGAAASPAFQLTTASGKKLEVGTAALERGRRFMSEVVTDASGEDDTPSRGKMKRTASDMLTRDPATPGQVCAGVALLDKQTAVSSVEMPSALREGQTALIGQWQGKSDT